MSQGLRKQFKRQLIKLAILAVASMNVYSMSVPIQAATAHAASVENLQKEIKTTNGSIIKVDKIKKDADGKYYVTLSIENSKGLPKQVTQIMGAWYINFTVNKVRYGLLPLKPGMILKVDQADEHKMTYTTEAQLIRKTGKGEPQRAKLEAEEINGQKGCLQVGTLYLFNQKDEPVSTEKTLNIDDKAEFKLEVK